MTRYAVIKNGSVVNVVLASEESNVPLLEEGMQVVASQTAAVGWIYDGASFTPPAPVETKDSLLAAVNFKAQELLKSISYDNNSFDLSGNKEDLLHKWYSGSQAYGDFWGGGTWIHATTPYSISTASACNTWAMALFALSAVIHNARDSHELAIEALTTQTEIDNYDTDTGWS